MSENIVSYRIQRRDTFLFFLSFFRSFSLEEESESDELDDEGDNFFLFTAGSPACESSSRYDQISGGVWSNVHDYAPEDGGGVMCDELASPLILSSPPPCLARFFASNCCMILC